MSKANWRSNEYKDSKLAKQRNEDIRPMVIKEKERPRKVAQKGGTNLSSVKCANKIVVKICTCQKKVVPLHAKIENNRAYGLSNNRA